jgi:hypothetical protein
MKIVRIVFLYTIILVALCVSNLNAQIGYHNAPYTRYEANVGTLTNGAASTTKSYNQADLQSEASEQICVNLPNTGSSIQWTLTSEGDGLVVRYSVPDGQTGTLELYANGTYIADLSLTTTYSWESLWNNGNPNNAGVSNQNSKMRFDEVRYKFATKIPSGGTLRLARKTGSANIHIDFAEMELVPPPIASYGSVYSGDGSTLQTFINANDGGNNTIFLPAGIYYVNSQIYFDVDNTYLRGAGMWYTQIHFINGSANNGGLRSNANNINFADLYLTTVRNSRSNSYKAINGAFTNGADITNVWAEHFECGAWIAQYSSGPSPTNGLTVSGCRFRNNYADGINLCKGTRNTIVEYCSFRNNGDDDMAMWSADGQECQNNTFRYCTSENCWRASGCAIYGGYNNKAHNLLIKDPVECGLRVNNSFPGAPFNAGGMHEFYNIAIYRAGTSRDLFDAPVGAIDIKITNVSDTRVRNVKFSCINIVDSKNDAIYINKTNGAGIDNLVFENITMDGTGREYPNNGSGTRGHFILFKGSPNGSATYCGMSYANRGGNATVDVNTTEKGTLTWTAAGSCPGGCTVPTDVVSSVNLTSTNVFGACTNPVTLTATATPPAGNTVSYVEFFVDGVSKGTDNTSTYSITWSNPTIGDHDVTAVAHFSGGTSSSSPIQDVVIADGIYSTGTAPTIDGTIDAVWNNFLPFTLGNIPVGTISGAADLSATFKVTRDATNLYVLVEVTDDALRNESTAHWEDDAIELFIDMGNDKAATYGANDFAYTFAVGETAVSESQHSPASTTGVTFTQGAKIGGYIFEIRIPWAALGGAQAAGTFVGFEVHVNDDDDNGTRDAKKTWYGTIDNAYATPSALGTLQIAGCSNPLPVSIVTFTGERKETSVVLNWTTAQEINNHKFVVERSADGIHWEVVGETAGAGNSTTITEYNYRDPISINSITYYRLKQLDFDGTVAYSNVVVLEPKEFTLNIHPNPFEEVLMLRTDTPGNLEIRIHDLVGKLVYHHTQTNDQGVLQLQPDLKQGVYVITVQTAGSLEQQTIIRK